MSAAGNLIEGVEDGCCLDCGEPVDTLMPGLCGPCVRLAEAIYPGGAAARLRMLEERSSRAAQMVEEGRQR